LSLEMPFYALPSMPKAVRRHLLLPVVDRRDIRIYHWFQQHPEHSAYIPTSFGGVDDFDEPVNVVSDILSPGAHPTVVSLPKAEENFNQEPQAGPADFAAVQLDYVVEEQVVEEQLIGEQIFGEEQQPFSSPSIAPVADMELDDGELAGDELLEPAPSVPVSAKKRGRPSMTPGKTPSKKATPAASKTSTASRSVGRKRKADEADEELAAEPTPAKKRAGRPAGPRTGPASSASARLAAKAPKRGRPAGASTVSLPSPALSREGRLTNESTDIRCR
jgi:hypothetical protein